VFIYKEKSKLFLHVQHGVKHPLYYSHKRFTNTKCNFLSKSKVFAMCKPNDDNQICFFKLTTRYSNTSPRQSHLCVPKSWFNFSSTRVYTNFSLIRIWTTMCLFLLPLWLNRLLHTSHENGFSPVCIRSCRTLSLRLAKDLEQNRHGKCLTPSIMYVLSSDAEMKR